MTVRSAPKGTDEPSDALARHSAWERLVTIPYSDDIPARRFPWVNTLLIAANFAVFLFYELPDPEAAVRHASFYPCEV